MAGWMDRQKNGWTDREMDGGQRNGGIDGLMLELITAPGMQDKGTVQKRRLSTHIRQLADGVCFDCDVVLLQLLLDFINALRDILCLKGKKIVRNYECLAKIVNNNYFRKKGDPKQKAT